MVAAHALTIPVQCLWSLVGDMYQLSSTDPCPATLQHFLVTLLDLEGDLLRLLTLRSIRCNSFSSFPPPNHNSIFPQSVSLLLGWLSHQSGQGSNQQAIFQQPTAGNLAHLPSNHTVPAGIGTPMTCNATAGFSSVVSMSMKQKFHSSDGGRYE